MVAPVYKQEGSINSHNSPHPSDWSSIHDKKCVNIPIQTSRGIACQNECYNVIQYTRKHHRTKAIVQSLQKRQNNHVTYARIDFPSRDNPLNYTFTRGLLKSLITRDIKVAHSNFSLAFTFSNFLFSTQNRKPAPEHN